MITIPILLLLTAPIMRNSAQICGSCEVDGTRYRGNSFFMLDKGCNKYNCRCQCDGSFFCPPALTKVVCQKEGTSGPQLQDCMVTYRIFRPGHSCKGNSDGFRSCPAYGVTDICQIQERGIKKREDRECTPCNEKMDLGNPVSSWLHA